MKHCILMTAYKDVAMINRFIATIPTEWGIYVHLDRKSSIRIEEIDSRATVIKRFKIYWGGWEHLYAFWSLLKMAFQSGHNYDYYHLVTGQDYLAVNPLHFDEILGTGGTNYIETIPIPRVGWWEGGEQIFQYHTLASFFDIRNGFAKWINVKYLQFQKFFNLKRKLPSFPLYSGIIYGSLHKDFVRWLFEAPLARGLLFRLKNSILAEEVFFSTAIMNSPFKETCAKINLRYIDWETIAPNLKVLLLEDYEKIIASHSLFARKVDFKESASLLSCIDKNILKYND